MLILVLSTLELSGKTWWSFCCQGWDSCEKRTTVHVGSSTPFSHWSYYEFLWFKAQPMRRMEKMKEPEMMKAMQYSKQNKWILILILPLTSCVIYIRWATALFLCQHFNSQIKDLDFRSTQVLTENIPGGLPFLRKTHSLFHLRPQREDRPSVSHSLSWPPVVYVLKVLYFMDRASPPELDSYYHAGIQVFLIHEWVRWVQTFY